MTTILCSSQCGALQRIGRVPTHRDTPFVRRALATASKLRDAPYQKFVRRALATASKLRDAPYQKSLIQPSLTKYFPGNCLTRRFSSSCKSVEETAALGRSLRAAMSSMEVSVASIAP